MNTNQYTIRILDRIHNPDEVINYSSSDEEESAEEKKIKNMFKKKQISPRTYDRKKKELEVWVTIEHDEVKKTKKIFEDDH